MKRQESATIKRTSKAQAELRDIENFDWLVAGVDVLSFDRLLGEIFTHSELLGLTERQIQAYKASLRRLAWDWFNTHFDNTSGLVDISRQCRVTQGLESHTTGTATYVTVTQ